MNKSDDKNRNQEVRKVLDSFNITLSSDSIQTEARKLPKLSIMPRVGIISFLFILLVSFISAVFASVDIFVGNDLARENYLRCKRFKVLVASKMLPLIANTWLISLGGIWWKY